MASHQITIKDIARTLGISPSTVSRALKDHPDISAETRKQVQQLANSVNYRPNALALSLRRSKSNTIGVVIPEMVHHFFSTVISGIDDYAFSKGYNTMLCQTNEDPNREMRNIQALLDSRVDGLLISVSKNTQSSERLQKLIDSGFPVTFFDRVCEDVVTHKVITDDFEGGRIATKHLVRIGCKRIAHLSSPESLTIGRLRKEGYCTALQEAGLTVDPHLILEADSSKQLHESSEQLVTIASEIDGIFATNDDTAVAAIQILQRNGYKVPDDIAVIGFGDGPITDLVSPTLSTVVQKGYDIGYEAARMLISQIDNELVTLEFETRIFTPELRVRESSQHIF